MVIIMAMIVGCGVGFDEDDGDSNIGTGKGVVCDISDRVDG